MADDGFGTSITFESGFFAEITNVDWSGLSREDMDISHMGLAAPWMEFQPTDLIDPGELGVELSFDPDDEPPISEVAENCTVTWPLPAGQSNPATWVCSAYLKNYQAGAPYRGKMTATATLKFSGEITFTPSS